MNLREAAQAVFRAALHQADGRRCTAAWLQNHALEGPVWAVAVGKAAAAMAEGARQALGPRLQRGLLITKHGHLAAEHTLCGPFACREAGHPVPDAASLRAGQQLLDLIADAPSSVHWLFLLSGGASSLVEVLPEGRTLQTLQRAQQWLLGSGLAIAEVNRIRKGLSLIKGGRLATRLGGAAVTALMISDVPDDDPAVVGSGLLAAGWDDAQLPQAALPSWLRSKLAVVPAAPRPDDPALLRVRHHTVASLDTACRGAVDRAGQLGFEVVHHRLRLAGDAAETGRQIGRLLRDAPAGMQIWGGETTVTLPSHSGRGGRCQHLALAAALEMDGIHGACLLAAGTDGTDGPTPDAGAIVDGGTVARGRAVGLRPEFCLARADAGTFLDASGDLLRTGPTGTNVNDLLVTVKAD